MCLRGHTGKDHVDSKGLPLKKAGSGLPLPSGARAKHSSLLGRYRGAGRLPRPVSSQLQVAELGVSRLGEASDTSELRHF